MERGGYVYILTNINHNVLYIGVTSNLRNRIHEHKTKIHTNGFTARYNCDIIVYLEGFNLIEDAIAREKQLKNWKRVWKIDLINKLNPNWIELDTEEFD
jgi:putative endonuclease